MKQNYLITAIMAGMMMFALPTFAQEENGFTSNGSAKHKFWLLATRLKTTQ